MRERRRRHASGSRSAFSFRRTSRSRVEAFGDNLLDEKYIKDAGNRGDALGLPTFIAGRPASFGVGFTVRYWGPTA